jgi:hypothetical protein
MKSVSACLKQVLQLKKELDIVKLTQEKTSNNDVEICDEDDENAGLLLDQEEDPDEQLFK